MNATGTAGDSQTERYFCTVQPASAGDLPVRSPRPRPTRTISQGGSRVGTRLASSPNRAQRRSLHSSGGRPHGGLHPPGQRQQGTRHRAGEAAGAPCLAGCQTGAAARGHGCMRCDLSLNVQWGAHPMLTGCCGFPTFFAGACLERITHHAPAPPGVSGHGRLGRGRRRHAAAGMRPLRAGRCRGRRGHALRQGKPGTLTFKTCTSPTITTVQCKQFSLLEIHTLRVPCGCELMCGCSGASAH